MTTPLEYAKSYEGDFPFMVAMKHKALRGEFFSPRMNMAIEKCMAHDNKAHATIVGTPDPTVGLDLTVLVKGSTYHAVKNSTGGLTFVRIDNVSKKGSSWNGWVFVKEIVGPQENRVGKQKPGERYVGTLQGVLGKVLHNPLASMARYGQEIGSCGRCNRRLTDDLSRERGIGPECWKAFGS